MRARWTATMAAGAMLTAGVGLADAVAAESPSLAPFGAYGIDRENARLVLYTFDEDNQGVHLPVGVLEDGDQPLVGIEGSTHVPDHATMLHAFWTDGQGQTHLLNVVPSEAESDSGYLVGAKHAIEGGKVTGAASFFTDDGQATRSFILQQESTIPTYEIDGRININPNNAEHMRFEFERVDADGQTLVSIDRAQLNDREWREAHGEVTDDGGLVVFDDVVGEGSVHDHESHKSMIQVRPKGEQTQDEIEIVSDTGETFELHNSNTYNLTGHLRVKLYNDHYNAKNGMAMGKWWLELKGTAEFEQSEVGTINRIAELEVNQGEPEVVEAAVLNQETLAHLSLEQDQLIGLGGRLDAEGGIELFVAEGHEVYRVRPVESEGSFDADNPVIEPVLTLDADHNLEALDFAGAQLVGYDASDSGRFLVLNLEADEDADPVLMSTNKPGPDDLGTVTFMPRDRAEAMLRPNYD